VISVVRNLLPGDSSHSSVVDALPGYDLIGEEKVAAIFLAIEIIFRTTPLTKSTETVARGSFQRDWLDLRIK
jgi:hypothetical protein